MIPFGKYNGKTIKEVVSKDLQYSQWLITQPWFSIKFIELHNRAFAEGSKTFVFDDGETYIVQKRRLTNIDDELKSRLLLTEERIAKRKEAEKIQ